MKAYILTSAILALGTTASFAGPFELSERQMDGISAGALIEVEDVLNDNQITVGVAVPVNAAANVCAIAGRCAQDADGNQFIRVPGLNQNR